MIFFTLPVLLTITVYVTATPEDTRIQVKMLESGAKKGDPAGNLLLDVFHVVMQQSERGLVEWGKDTSVTMRPHAAVLFRKKYLGSEFLGKRNLGSEFLGKRRVTSAMKRSEYMRNV